MNMSDEEILNKLIFYLDNKEERDILANKGLKWSEKYSQEYYAKELINHINLFLNERN